MSDRRLRDITSASVAATAILVWEIVVTFDKEVEYIWPKPSTSWIKWAFLFSRYFTLSVQICNRAIEMTVLHGCSECLSVNAVRVWYICQVIAVFVATSGLDVILMARVYALHNQHRGIGAGFIFLLFAQMVTVAVGVAMSLQNAEFRPLDIVSRPPPSYIYLGASFLVTQLVILLLSLIKYSRENWRGIAIISLMLRDGMLTFAVITFMSMLVVIYTTLEFDFSSTLYAYFLSFACSAECRIILNMQSLSRDSTTRGTSNATTLQMTTLFTQPRNDYATEDSCEPV